MADTLSGCDISVYQGNIDWPNFKNNVNFAIIKMTEGVNYIDPWGGNNRHQARQLGLPVGFYHFARPDTGNSPEDEAQFFINVMNGQPLQVGESVYLDYEVQYGGDNVAWVLAWMQAVEKALGVKPIFYSYQSMLTQYDWTPVVSNGNGLWVATASNDPTNTNFQTGAWSFAMMNQWGQQTIPGVNGVVDSDIFYGTLDEFKAYGYHVPQLVQPPVITPPPIVPQPPTPPITPPTQTNQPLSGGVSSTNFLSGYKTYIVAGVMVVYALVNLFNHGMTQSDAITTILQALGISALRNGVSSLSK